MSAESEARAEMREAVLSEDPSDTEAPPADNRAPCPVCTKAGRDGKLDFVVEGRHECKTCLVGFDVPVSNEIPALLHDIQQNAGEREAILFSPRLIERLLPEHKDMLQDAWTNIVWKRDNAGLLILGALIEATLREIVLIKKSILIDGGLYDLILYAKDENVVPRSYLLFADRFREEVRNLWQHQRMEVITTGGVLKGIEITWPKDGGATSLLEKLKEATEAFKDPKNLQDFRVEDHAWAEYPRKLQIEAVLAPYLYNQTWLWLLFVTTKALRSHDYESYRERQKTNPNRLLRKQRTKGGGRTWTVVKPTPVPPFERRPLPAFSPRKGD